MFLTALVLILLIIAAYALIQSLQYVKNSNPDSDDIEAVRRDAAYWRWATLLYASLAFAYMFMKHI